MSDTRTDSILSAFKGDVPHIRVPILYRLGMLTAAVTMVLLPLVYFGLIALTAVGVIYHAIENIDILYPSGGVLMRLLVYLMPIIAGGTLVLFMLRPVLAAAPKQAQQRRLEPEDEPLLFAFVARLCRAVGARRPHAIHLDWQVNASASFWRGWLGMLSGRLVLTIGMPLAAGLSLREFAGVLGHEFGHFAQGGGMRLTYIIRSVNHWFTRVVYERDEWDTRLQEWSEEGPWFTMALFAFTRLFVRLSRWVLWVLMMLGHIISSFMLRQMEFDADRYEAGLAGSDAFEATMRRLSLLAVANARAHADLESAWADQRLADDLPALVLANLESMPARVRREVEKEQGKAKTDLLDSHPADADRIGHARELAAAGIFRPDAPGAAEPLAASVLFSDFEALSKAVSLTYYRDVLELTVQDQNLLPTDTIARQESGWEQAWEAVGRFFQNTVLPSLPLGITAEQPPAAGKEEGALRDELVRLREELLATGPETRSALADLDRLNDRLVNVAQAHCLVTNGHKIEADAFGLEAADMDHVVSAFEGVKEKIGELLAAVGSSTRPLRRRLELAVGGLEQASVAAHVNDAESARREVHKLWPLLSRVERALPDVRALRVPFEQTRMLVGIMEQGEQSDALLAAVEPRSQQLVEHLASIRQALGDVPFPFEHATENLLVADYVTGDVPPPSKFEEVLEVSYHTISRAWTLYFRLLGSLVGLAEQVESALNLEPLPELPDETSA